MDSCLAVLSGPEEGLESAFIKSETSETGRLGAANFEPVKHVMLKRNSQLRHRTWSACSNSQTYLICNIFKIYLQCRVKLSTLIYFEKRPHETPVSVRAV